MTGPGPGAAARLPALHLPDEPLGRKAEWRSSVLGGTAQRVVAGDDGGVGEWLWCRWRALQRAGIDEPGLRAIVVGSRRELGLWLHGDRTWVQYCSGLIGRIGRRIDS